MGPAQAFCRWKDSHAIRTLSWLRLYRNGECGGSIVAPESKAVIEAFITGSEPGRQEKENKHVYDMIIIGGGPGGCTAALYAARAGLDAVILEKLSAGGQMAQTYQIDNYPGFVEGIGGFDLDHIVELSHGAIVCNASENDMEYFEEKTFTRPVALYNRHSDKYSTVTINDHSIGILAADLFAKVGRERAEHGAWLWRNNAYAYRQFSGAMRSTWNCH